MKISHKWLSDYIQTDKSPEEIAAMLTDTGLEVEKVFEFESIPGGLKGVVVGEVLGLEKHPDADRLRVAKVNIGASEPLIIVCGAANIALGQKVVVATVDAVLLPESEKPLKIQRSKIRGVESAGMICAEDELGIGTSHDGIMVLPSATKVGTPAADYFHLESDWVYEIGLTPNRTDAFGHFGVARDLAARLNLERDVKASMPALAALPAADCAVKVVVEDEAGCGRYAGIVIKNLKIEESPAWLRNRLKAIGISPINNVVDITNYVQHELGQPLHAFDFDKIGGKKIVVRTAPQNSAFVGLDGVSRKLQSEDLMICDAEKPMCIAGVFGGFDSGVSAATTAIFLESAWFNASRVRKTAKHHDLHTDAAFRFERGVDPNGTLNGLARAVELLVEIAQGCVEGGVCDIQSELPKPVEVEVALSKLNAFLGSNIESNELIRIFGSLDMEVISAKAEVYKLRLPTYRVDVTRDTDVYEEVLRIYGYNRVAEPERMLLSVNIPAKPEKTNVLNGLSQMLIGRGFMETLSNGLTRSDYIKAIAGGEYAAQLIAMLNPLSMELDVLRPHLFPSLLDTAAYNLNRQADRLQYFEIGSAYRLKNGSHEEDTRLGLVLSGGRFIENWNNPKIAFDSTDMRGHFSAIFDFMGLSVSENVGSSHAYLEQLVVLHTAGVEVGLLGKLSAGAARVYGIKKEVWLGELNLSLLLPQMRHAAINYREVERFPGVRRDLSLLIDKSVSFEAISSLIQSKGGQLVREVSLFDVYEGKNLPEGKKSYAVGIALQDPKQTLNDKRIDHTMNQVITALQESFGATLR